MGYGDSLMALGDAWAQYQDDPTKRKVAIGDGSYADPAIYPLAQGMDFIATPEDIAKGDVSWVISYVGNRPYIDYPAMRKAAMEKGFRSDSPRKLISKLGHYIYQEDYRAKPAPIVLTDKELELSAAWSADPYIVVEPFVKEKAPPSKQYPLERFKEVVEDLKKDFRVFQISPPHLPSICGLPRIPANSFRETLAYLHGSSLYIGPEGGLHHGAASVGASAVVLFGGFISAKITGYDFHVNLDGGNPRGCGTRHDYCKHCESIFAQITPESVVSAARRILNEDDNAL